MIEAIFTIGALIFIATLIQPLRTKAQFPRWSSIATAAVLTTYVFAFAQMGQTYSAVTTAGTALLWWLIAIYRPIKVSTE